MHSFFYSPLIQISVKADPKGCTAFFSHQIFSLYYPRYCISQFSLSIFCGFVFSCSESTEEGNCISWYTRTKPRKSKTVRNVCILLLLLCWSQVLGRKMLQKEWQMLLSFQSSCKCKIGRYTLLFLLECVWVLCGILCGTCMTKLLEVISKSLEFFWPVFLFLSGFLQSFLFL